MTKATVWIQLCTVIETEAPYFQTKSGKEGKMITQGSPAPVCIAVERYCPVCT